MFSTKTRFLYNFVIIFLDTILFSSFLIISIVILFEIGTENLIIEFFSSLLFFFIVISILFPAKSWFGFPYFYDYLKITGLTFYLKYSLTVLVAISHLQMSYILYCFIIFWISEFLISYLFKIFWILSPLPIL